MKAALVALLAAVLQQPAGSLRGVVVDSETRAPVAAARVLLTATGRRLADSVMLWTDDRGAFAFSNLGPGDYVLLADHDEYLRSTPSPPVHIAVGAAGAALTLALIPTVAISGRVTDEFGDPAARVYVRALTTKIVAEARTNDLGEYRLFGLPAGAYVVSAQRYAAPSIEGASVSTPTSPCPDCMGEGTGRQPLAGLLATGSFIDPRAIAHETSTPVFFPGTTDRAAASALNLTAGAKLAGIDLHLVTP